MRTMIAVLVGAAILTGNVGCTRSAQTVQAWTRWGITKPTTEPGVETKLADAHRLLYALKLDSAQAAYQDLVRRYPQSAEAHLGLSMAFRYSGKRDTALNEARVAFALDPDAAGTLLNYADLILPIRTGDIPGMSTAQRYAESERCNLKAAASNHPFNAHAHTGLWAAYMAQGRLADARQQLRELGRKGYYQQPLLDFCRNLLVGLEPNAVLFTNGDNDTYPAWVVQTCDQLRPDVTVANLSLLNIPTVVKMMKDSLGLPVSLTDEQIVALAPKPGADGKGVLVPSQQVVENVIANAARAGRPVYFAVTVSDEMTDVYADRLVFEGLVNRVAEGNRSAAVDLARITENMTRKYRLDWPMTMPPWPANMSPLTSVVTPMAMNYAFTEARVAACSDSLGRKADAANALAEATEWALRAGRPEAARVFVNGALGREPNNAKARELKARLDQPGAVN